MEMTMALHVTDANFAAEVLDGQPVDLKVGAGQSRVQLIKWLEMHAT